MKIADSKKDTFPSPILVGAVLFAATLLAFWQTLKYPFIQDDWFIIDALRRSGPLEFLKDNLANAGAVFYRPLGAAYFAGAYALFGMNPLGIHCVALLFHFLSSLLVAYIAYTLTRDLMISWISAFMYALAMTVQLDALLWMVGIFDVGGAFFFFLAIALFLRGRTVWSALAYCAALLMKESTVVLPLILVTAAVVRLNERSLTNIRRAGVSLGPHFILMVLYLALRQPNASEAAGAGYAINYFGAHILRNAALYAGLLAESVVPFVASHRSSWIFLIGVALISFVVWKNRNDRPLLILLGGWLVIGILPALVLENHTFSYYLIYSMPAFCIVLSLGVRALATSIFPGTIGSMRLIALIMAVKLALSTFYVLSLDKQGFDAPTIDGSNNLMRKGKLVEMTKDFLTHKQSVLPKGAMLLFDWLPTISFGVRIGPAIWCRDTSMSVYELRRDSLDSIHMLDPLHPAVEPPSPRNYNTAFILAFHGIKLEMARMADLYK